MYSNKIINKEKLRDYAISEIKKLYHNATVHFPCIDLSEDEQQSVFDYLQWELGNIGSGASCNSLKWYQDTCHDPVIARLKFQKEVSQSKDYFLIKDLVSEYGELYQYGRGGATVAPEKLASTTGRGWSFNTDLVYDLSSKKLMDLIEGVRALNRIIRRECSVVGVSWIISDILDNRLEVVNDDKKDLLKDIKELNESVKITRAHGKVCDLIKNEVKEIKYAFDTLLKESIDLRDRLCIVNRLIKEN